MTPGGDGAVSIALVARHRESLEAFRCFVHVVVIGDVVQDLVYPTDWEARSVSVAATRGGTRASASSRLGPGTHSPCASVGDRLRHAACEEGGV